jgi:4-hydroxybenzoate polyprenyltransferase
MWIAGEAEISEARTRFMPMVRLVRPHQWAKNLLVFAALIFSRRLLDYYDVLLAIVAFVAFCALASFAYVLNDIMDREADRLNPEKRNRPLASGEIGVSAAGVLAACLGVGALGLSAALGWGFLGIAFAYIGLQFAYSLWAKHVVIVDVMAVALGFVLRAFAGGVAIQVVVSPWLIFITFVLALFLALSRRRHEHREALGEYSVRLIDQMLGIVAAATLVGYLIYSASMEVETKLGTRYQYLTVPYVVFGILRYVYLVQERDEGGDPSLMLFSDRQLMISVFLWIATEILLLYA